MIAGAVLRPTRTRYAVLLLVYLAAFITFLASPDNRATRGAVIPVYGGS